MDMTTENFLDSGKIPHVVPIQIITPIISVAVWTLFLKGIIHLTFAEIISF